MASVGALIGVVGVMAIPVAAPLTGAVVTVGAVTAVYGIVRSTINLVDRGTHEQVRYIKQDVSESRKQTSTSERKPNHQQPGHFYNINFIVHAYHLFLLLEFLFFVFDFGVFIDH